MKKTLAAVLAAAMALSTATVAFADDSKLDTITFGEGTFSTEAIEKNAKMGDTTNYLLTEVKTEDGETIYGADIARAMRDGDLTASVVVTSNQSKLDGRPTLTAGKKVTTVNNQNTTETTTFYWKDDIETTEFKMEGAPFTARAKREVKTIYVVWNGANFDICEEPEGVAGALVIRKGDKYTVDVGGNPKTFSYVDVMKQVVAATDGQNWVRQDDSVKKNDDGTDKSDTVKLSFKINHTYGVDDVTVKMKLRFTAKRDVDEGSLVMDKGDTLTSVEVAFKAGYSELANYYEDMQLTKEEVKANRVILNGENLYNAIGDSKFTITFGDDIAMFEGKASAAQKKINLYYNTNEITAVQEKFPDIDFTYLTFVGNPVPSFQNTGTLYFSAENDDYTVYEWDGEYLNPVSDRASFDKTYKTVKVKNVKKLGSYVISPVILPEDEEPEEPAEPVDSTPVAEPDDEGQNPNTGAC